MENSRLIGGCFLLISEMLSNSVLKIFPVKLGVPAVEIL